MKRLMILSVLIASILYSKEDKVIVSINGLESAGLSKRYINYAQYTIQEISIDLEETVSKMIGDKYSINIHFTAYEAVENTINVARDSLNIIIKTVKDKYPDEDLVTHSISHPYKGIQGVIIGKVQIQVNIDNSINLDKSIDISKKSSEIFDWIFMDLQDCHECISYNNVDMDSINEKNTLSLNRDDIYDDSWAVIIGIDKYKYSKQLNYAVKDAEAVKDILINKFDFPEENIRYLTDEEATLSNIKLNLGEVATSAGENDRILVFYSGHGETLKGADGSATGYIIPYEGRQDNPYATGLVMDEILRTCQISKSKHMLFLMDACYSGLMTENVKGLSKPQEKGYLSKVANEKARQIITAGNSDEQVIERDEWQHSAFTKNLIEGLDTWEADYNDDGYITADELSSYLREHVTEDSDFLQTPQDGRFRNSGGGEFVFINSIVIENQTINISDNSEKHTVPSDNDLLKSRLEKLERQLKWESEIIQNLKKTEDSLQYSNTSFFNDLMFTIDFGYSNSGTEELNQYIINKSWEFENQGINDNQLHGLFSFGFTLQKKILMNDVEFGLKKLIFSEKSAFIQIKVPDYSFYEEYSNYNHSIYFSNILFPIIKHPVKLTFGGGINLSGTTLNYIAIIDTMDTVLDENVRIETANEIQFSGSGVGFQLKVFLILLERSNFELKLSGNLFYINTKDLIGDISFTSNTDEYITNVDQFKLFYNNGLNDFSNYIGLFELSLAYHFNTNRQGTR